MVLIQVLPSKRDSPGRQLAAQRPRGQTPCRLRSHALGDTRLPPGDGGARRREVANRHRAVLFVHHGPRPGDAFPKVTGNTNNARRRNGTLDMQASLSSVMVTLCLTDYLASYPDAMIHIHNLGGNIPYEVERMDQVAYLVAILDLYSRKVVAPVLPAPAARRKDPIDGLVQAPDGLCRSAVGRRGNPDRKAQDALQPLAETLHEDQRRVADRVRLVGHVSIKGVLATMA